MKRRCLAKGRIDRPILSKGIVGTFFVFSLHISLAYWGKLYIVKNGGRSQQPLVVGPLAVQCRVVVARDCLAGALM